MSNWGASLFKQERKLNESEQYLFDLINEHPAKLKQAMFSAASKGPIFRHSWNGCAMNAAGGQVQKEVFSAQDASEAFGISRAQVGLFIEHWDSLEGSDELVTALLREMIERSGLFTEPGEHTPRIISVKIYENQQKKLREQFDSLMLANMIPDTEIALDLLTVPSV